MTTGSTAPFVDFRAALATARREGERLATSLSHDVRTFVARGPDELRREIRVRADAAVRDLETRGTQVVDAVERQVARSFEALWRRFAVATHGEIDALAGRVAALEERLALVERSRRGKSRRRRGNPAPSYGSRREQLS